MSTSEKPAPQPFWHGRGTLFTPCDVCGAKVNEKCTDVESLKAEYTKGFADGEKYGVDGAVATIVLWLRTVYRENRNAQAFADAIEKRSWMQELPK
jgi:hypothetical protein